MEKMRGLELSPVIDGYGKSLLLQILTTAPIKYISFLHQPLPDRLIMRIIPEVRDFELLFNRNCLQQWRSELFYHDVLVQRGSRMRLGPLNKLPNLRCVSLDEYLLRFRCLEVAKALASLCRFLKRIIPKIAKTPSAQFWRVTGAVVVTRDSWETFREEVLRLTNQLERRGRAIQPKQPPDIASLLASTETAIKLLSEQAAC